MHRDNTGVRIRRYFASILILGFVCCGDIGDAAVHSLFLDSSDEEKTFSSADASPSFSEPARRWKQVALSPVVAEENTLAVGDVIRLDLFKDRTYMAVVDRIARNVNDTVSVRARLEGHPLGYLLISTTDGRSLASIRVPEKGELYRISSVGPDARHYLLDLEGESFDSPESAPPEISPPPTAEEPKLPPGEQRRLATVSALDPATIDVMVVYTPAARTWANASGGGMANVVAQAMEKAQLTLENSDVLASVRLVHSGEVDYQESGNHRADLRRLTASPTFNPWGETWEGYTIPNHMNEVHILRDAYRADLVALFEELSGVGGVGWQLANSTGRPSYGFTITRVQQAATGYTHIHEMGHNMGAHHHKEQSTSPGPTSWRDWSENTWSAGWRWVGMDSQRYCSVMTYQEGTYYSDGLRHTRVAYFSNPDVSHQRVRTGHGTEGDNARTLRATKHVVAAYRTAESIALAEAIDQPAWAVATGGDGHWAGQTATTFDGKDAAKSGLIGHGRESWMETTVRGSGRLRFRWKVSSEANSDSLEFHVNSTLHHRISGEVDWQQKTYDLEAGTHTLRWLYTKSMDTVRGLDAGWVDEVVWDSYETGSLRITISPQEAIEAGARWRRVGETTWLDSGTTEPHVTAEVVTVEFQEVGGWQHPAPRTLAVPVGGLADLDVEYHARGRAFTLR